MSFMKLKALSALLTVINFINNNKKPGDQGKEYIFYCNMYK